MISIQGLLRRAGEEAGIAMVTAVLVTAVVVVLSTVSVELAVHNSSTSAYDRDRILAIHAANAGIDQMFAYFKGATAADVCAASTGPASTGTLTGPTGGPIAQFHVVTTVVAPASCPGNPTSILIQSTGYSLTQGGAGHATREMESLVTLKQRVFGHAMFHGSSTTTLTLQNQTNGYLFLDADVYSNADVLAGNGVTVSGDITSQGKVTLEGNSIVKGTVWARKSITMANSAFVASNAVASTKVSPDCGCIAMANNTRIAGNARAAGSITAVKIDGTQTPNSPSNPPPMETLPLFTWLQSDPWPTPKTLYTTCTGTGSFMAWVTANQSALQGTARIASFGGSQSNCAFNPANNAVMGLDGDLAIINDGDISLSQQSTWNSTDGQVHNLYFISTKGNVNFGNNTNFDSKVHVFVFTPNTATLSNQNAWSGQVFANVLNITNNFTLNYVNLFPPGFSSSSVIGYSVDPTYIREVIPS